ncbi:hypothetical protein BDZ97DRAFT_1669493 [Flammula alnicola]|nr:hypothetical protein BDZ97DRAFT_1669493 [Flammula alnicola]
MVNSRPKGSSQTIVSEATTLRRHIEANHLTKYITWCDKNNFESKLPKAVKARKDAKEAEDRSKQSSLDPHLEERPPKETFVPYSDSLFREAAIEWLIATDQPIQALEHPSFQKMIDIAARGTKGVKIPNRKATRKHIINLFKKNLDNLRIKITVRFQLPT